jgi:hypothetical protein
MKRLIAFGLPAMMLRIRRRNHRTRNGSRQADSGPQNLLQSFTHRDVGDGKSPRVVHGVEAE